MSALSTFSGRVLLRQDDIGKFFFRWRKVIFSSFHIGAFVRLVASTPRRYVGHLLLS